MTRFALALGLAVTAALAAPVHAGSPASPTVVAAAMASPQHKTLVAAIKAADLAGTLSGKGPFTVFAPTDTAFAALPAGTVDTLLKPQNRDALVSVLTYHVVPGKVTAAELVKAIGDNNGSVALTTVEGGKLTASLDGGKVRLTDEKGGTATVVATDLMASNGIIHVTDAVSLPN